MCCFQNSTESPASHMDPKRSFLLRFFIWLKSQILQINLRLITGTKNLLVRNYQTICIFLFQNFLSNHSKKASSLPRQSIGLPIDLHNYNGFWFFPVHLEGIMSGQELLSSAHKVPNTILASTPKTGTTWLKALSYAISTRRVFDLDSIDHPLRLKSPHECVPFVEFDLVNAIKSFYPFSGINKTNGSEMFGGFPVVATHMPCSLLPDSVFENRSCKIVYIWRDPKDAFVSSWDFLVKIGKDYGVDPDKLRVDDVFELFCRGVSNCGPYWDHVIGFLKAAQEHPDKVMCLKYEDMIQEPCRQVEDLAKFMSNSFSPEEEQNGVVKKIVELCSFNHLRSLEVNKNGEFRRINGLIKIKNSGFFRKGQVGDWKNYLSDEMAARLDRIFLQKFAEAGLKFQG